MAVLLVLLVVHPSAHAQDYVLESRVTLTASVLTQGPDASVTTVKGGTTITTKRIITSPFNNHEVLAAMAQGGLIAGSLHDWNLFYLADSKGTKGVYARKAGGDPVPVPVSLLTLPVFGPKVSGGMTVAGPKGSSFNGINEVSYSTASVNGVPATGLASNSVQTITFTRNGISKEADVVSTTMTFAGGASDANGDRLVKGVIVVGSATLSTLTSLPPAT